jgi:ABC-type phosphate/phosphonate transport system substrate-binding protein
VLVAIVPIAVAAVPAPQVRAAEPGPLKIGMPESMFSGLPPSVVQVGAQPFKDMFEKQTGLKGEIAVVKDYADSTAQLCAGKLDVAVFHGFEYAWVKQHTELIPLLIAVPGSKIQACIVVNAECTAAGPAALKGECLAIPTATKAHCHLYLERLKEKLPAGTCGPAKLEGKTIEDALDAVASGKCEAALVDVSTLEGYKRNKPGVGTHLKILDQSDLFPAGVIVFRNNVFNAKAEKNLRDGLIKSIETPQGKLLKGLWKLEGFAEVNQAYQTDLDKCLKAYPAPKQQK